MEQRIGNVRVSHVRNALLFLTALFVLGAANAGTIEIEPDNYAEGTDLSNVSPYVTLAYGTPDPSFPPEPVYASAPAFGFPAPTGNLTFGNFAGGPGFCGDTITFDCFGGFAMSFHQPVTEVSLLAINSNYPPGLSAWWAAFDSDGALLDFGGDSGETADNYGIPFELRFDVPNMASLVVGGSGLTRCHGV